MATKSPQSAAPPKQIAGEGKKPKGSGKSITGKPAARTCSVQPDPPGGAQPFLFFTTPLFPDRYGAGHVGNISAWLGQYVCKVVYVCGEETLTGNVFKLTIMNIKQRIYLPSAPSEGGEDVEKNHLLTSPSPLGKVGMG
jgi:hypothetical protein